MNDDASDPRQPRRGLLLLCIVAVMIISGVGWTLWVSQTKHSPSGGMGAANEAAIQAGSPPPLPLPGEQILQNYASDSVRPQDDLSMMAHALSNLTLLIKGPAPLRLSANEEFAAALRGKNPAQLRFLPDTHPAFNGRYQIVDRWQTPLFFHALGHDRLDIRSAGPDRQMWTEDDLHRHYDGQFLTGTALNSASLFDDGLPGKPPR